LWCLRNLLLAGASSPRAGTTTADARTGALDTEREWGPASGTEREGDGAQAHTYALAPSRHASAPNMAAILSVAAADVT
jgi:hypothetical protein